MQNVVILGSTGSVGTNTLNVIRLHPSRYKVIALVAHSNWGKLLLQCKEFQPNYAYISEKKYAGLLQAEFSNNKLTTKVLCDRSDLIKLVTMPEADIVMSAIVGSQGLEPTYHALLAGKKVLLANKESLVTGGKLIIDALNKNKQAKLIPVDSEHSAIFQALPDNGEYANSIHKIILTASGGPFRNYSLSQLENVTPEDATKHPNWSMGKKISVDSSTLMNKGLEVIEAHWLFKQSPIEVVVHPQSIIHSMVEYIDGSIIAQLGVPDMKTPIAYALSYPDRMQSGSNFLNFNQISQLTFEAPDIDKFPCLNLAFSALKLGQAMPAVLNAANEVAVDAFLNYKIGYTAIYSVVSDTMDKFIGADFNSIEEAIAIDQESRVFASSII